MNANPQDHQSPTLASLLQSRQSPKVLAIAEDVCLLISARSATVMC